MDQALGKSLLAQALPPLVATGAEELLLDAGFIDGQWVRQLHEQWGLRLFVRVKGDMHIFQDALEQSRLRKVLVLSIA